MFLCFFVYSNCTAVMLLNRIHIEESLFEVLLNPRRKEAKRRSFCLLDHINRSCTLVGHILLESICRSACCYPREPDHHMLFTIIRTKICLKLRGELLNSYPDFSRVSKNQKSKSLVTSCLPFFYWILPLIVRCGWAWLPISFKPQTPTLPDYKSQPAKTRWWSRFPEIKADCCKSWSSLPFCIQGKHFGGGRRLFYQTLV